MHDFVEQPGDVSAFPPRLSISVSTPLSYLPLSRKSKEFCCLESQSPNPG